MSKKNQKSPVRDAKRRKIANRKSPLTEAAAQRLGYTCKDIAEADAVSGIGPNLSKYFERHPRLRKAFDRGRLLRYLGELAPNTLIYEAARRLKDLGFAQFQTVQDLADYLQADHEAHELWETARVNGQIENRQNLRKSAEAGNVKAITLLDKWMVDRQKETGELGSANFSRVGVNQMAELFDVTRTTIWEWYRDKGLPQNPDGSFDLQRAIKWFEDFTLKKSARGKDAVGPLNPFQAVKTKHAQMKLKQERGELVEREAVIGFAVAVMQNAVNAFSGLADLANRCFGQPREQIVERLEDFADQVMDRLKPVPPELKLPAAAEGKLAELYELLKPAKEDTGDRIQDIESKATEHSATENTEATKK